MKTIAIFHYQPIEKYPPILNLIDQLEKSDQDVMAVIYTTSCSDALIRQVKNVKVIVCGTASTNMLSRIFGYFYFYLFPFVYSLKTRPNKILYYETISSFTPLLLNRLFRKTEVLVHYHEYMTPEEYSKGMPLVKCLHWLEKKSLHRMRWISHTNKDRLKLFLADLDSNKDLAEVSRVLPNYPPSSWKDCLVSNRVTDKVKIVYVGYSLDLSTSYLKEFLVWLSQHKHVLFDAYLFYANNDILNLQKKYASFFHIKAAVPYKELPSVLRDYNVGVILYKAHISNCLYIAPNKLFEYYSCGLDVWFSDEILGCHEFITSNSYPKVVPVDFKNLSGYSVTELTDHGSLQYVLNNFTAESANQDLLSTLYS